MEFSHVGLAIFLVPPHLPTVITRLCAVTFTSDNLSKMPEICPAGDSDRGSRLRLRMGSGRFSVTSWLAGKHLASSLPTGGVTFLGAAAPGY